MVRQHQQQENLKFLSHFKRKFIIKTGRRPAGRAAGSEKVKPTTEFFQLRANGSPIATRCIQVCEMVMWFFFFNSIYYHHHHHVLGNMGSYDLLPHIIIKSWFTSVFFQLRHLANPIYIFIIVSSYWCFFSQVCSYYYVFTFISPHNAPKKNLECLHLIFITNLQFFMCFLRASLFYFSIHPRYSLHCPQQLHFCCQSLFLRLSSLRGLFTKYWDTFYIYL